MYRPDGNNSEVWMLLFLVVAQEQNYFQTPDTRHAAYSSRVKHEINAGSSIIVRKVHGVRHSNDTIFLAGYCYKA